jgi:alginate O-acetyltransferase complex protein AlgI
MEPWYVLLLFVTCTIAFLGQDGRLSRGGAIALLLGLLFVFKYYNFAAGQITALGLDLGSLSALDVALPVCISFYVFHAIGLLVDRSRGVVPSTRLMPLLSYIAFFPQLVAGPIVRVHTFVPQLQTPQVSTRACFVAACSIFAAGMFKKLVIADNVGAFVDSVYETRGAATGASHIIAFYLTRRVGNRGFPGCFPSVRHGQDPVP